MRNIIFCIVIQQIRDDRAHTTRTISEHNRVTFVNWIKTSALYLCLWYENRVSTESQICSASSSGPKIKYKHKFESTNRLIFPITPAALLFIELRIHQIQMLEFARELKSDLKDIFFVWWANTGQAEQREWIIIVNNKARFSLWTCTIKCSVDVVRLHCWLTEKYIPRPEDDYQTSCLSKQNIIQCRANSFESDTREAWFVWNDDASRAGFCNENTTNVVDDFPTKRFEWCAVIRVGRIKLTLQRNMCNVRAKWCAICKRSATLSQWEKLVFERLIWLMMQCQKAPQMMSI